MQRIPLVLATLAVAMPAVATPGTAASLRTLTTLAAPVVRLSETPPYWARPSVPRAGRAARTIQRRTSSMLRPVTHALWS